MFVRAEISGSIVPSIRLKDKSRLAVGEISSISCFNWVDSAVRLTKTG
jgi:hypothetical protein